MEAPNDKYDISLEDNYKGRKIEIKFWLNRKLTPIGKTNIRGN